MFFVLSEYCKQPPKPTASGNKFSISKSYVTKKHDPMTSVIHENSGDNSNYNNSEHDSPTVPTPKRRKLSDHGFSNNLNQSVRFFNIFYFFFC